MSSTDDPTTAGSESIHREYVLDVRIVETESVDADGPRYRFEAPGQRAVEFESAEKAELYADVYFDVNGFDEEGTGERGVPPEIIQAGKDTLSAYFLSQPGVDRNWVVSYWGIKPMRVDRYVKSVRRRAQEIRDGAAEMAPEELGVD
ncbi:hypothetical protein ACFO0N_11685 [Halobium salinum]|uniref:Uncharacterized protein n=1 Tax=Halobium salinum TaxID=1364940 RepID=A0ABD5PD80_9EURY|nr:hypothetical protein [Halobium salinum]